jgi:hypothetical protein
MCLRPWDIRIFRAAVFQEKSYSSSQSGRLGSIGWGNFKKSTPLSSAMIHSLVGRISPIAFHVPDKATETASAYGRILMCFERLSASTHSCGNLTIIEGFINFNLVNHLSFLSLASMTAAPVNMITNLGPLPSPAFKEFQRR